jgi:hypothetical protein
LTNFVSMCFGARSSRCLSTILQRSVASLRRANIVSCCELQRRVRASPVEMHHTHLAGFDFSEKFLRVRDLPVSNVTRIQRQSRQNMPSAPVLPVPLRLQLQQRFLQRHGYVSLSPHRQQHRTCFCFIAIKRRSRSSSSSSRPLQMCQPIAFHARAPRSHIVEHLNLLV